MNSKTLFDTIKSAIIEIETELIQLNGTGIYFAPEQYIAFCIGKAILKNKNSIFGSDTVEWVRENNLGEKGQDTGSTGITDIAFRVSDRTIAIELKLRGTLGKYKADIEKLSKLPDNIDKYFCVLLDSFSENNDERVFKLQQDRKSVV